MFTLFALLMWQLLDEQSNAVMVLSMLVMTAIVSPLIEILYKPKKRLDPSNMHKPMRTIQTMSRASEFQIISCVHNEENVPMPA